ncbi:uncharacterized protein MYCFIDRAFT_173926 [Pseudocercospora fijiensis CIRAD86]|uniref:Uncharacterized protein n=1 Tax=Pseudocercospora fijiensis (strain CIRAD86) TaxID=383855 RepID=M2Z5G4_PSEFD|nr:uncharacterized protein MYCFIDRAFT_173926 [Pseudocercospora fijiensis CIRAD86]EME85060.1 hypothetical protein MYCFIDRAFT_173926 [Pseudocercospora fijiensis CIRAD86]
MMIDITFFTCDDDGENLKKKMHEVKWNSEIKNERGMLRHNKMITIPPKSLIYQYSGFFVLSHSLYTNTNSLLLYYGGSGNL